MREIVIGKNDAGQRADNFIAKALPMLPPSLRQKFLRLKRIKRNGARCRPEDRLNEGDILALYIADEFFRRPAGDEAWQNVRVNLKIAYEDSNILVADKAPGMLVHSDDSGEENTLINHIKKYLSQRGEWDSAAEQSFTPALANRIDRNTGGLVLAAKNAAALRVLNDKIRSREIRKFYYCAVIGEMKPRDGRLDGYIKRDTERKTVIVGRERTYGSKTASTIYHTLAVRNGLSLLECELLTGRTHQIRAQFAAAGHPLEGDGKYGRNSPNRKGGSRYQALYSYKVVFDFHTPAGVLEYLKGYEVTAPTPDFAEAFLEQKKIDYKKQSKTEQ